jgi:hypothetical protein
MAPIAKGKFGHVDVKLHHRAQDGPARKLEARAGDHQSSDLLEILGLEIRHLGAPTCKSRHSISVPFSDVAPLVGHVFVPSGIERTMSRQRALIRIGVWHVAPGGLRYAGWAGR